jgi:CHAD domain-containing protein/CYTH domain-containing protein
VDVPEALPSDLLARPPQEAVRRICLALLASARAASKRLDDPKDEEALHDFRVAIRRLRSTLRAWRPLLKKSTSKKHRKQLRRLQNATGGGRDAEVSLAWLENQRGDLTAAQRRGHAWVAGKLRDRHDAAMDHVRDGVRAAFDRIDATLQDRLEVLHVEVHLLQPQSPETFGMRLAGEVRAHANAVADALARVRSCEDREQCHQARITGKRLRYLVEPARPFAREAAVLLRRCKRLQDVLGDLNDAFVLREELASAIEAASIEHGRRLAELALEADPERLRREVSLGPRTGLLELTRRVQLRIRELFDELERGWVESGAYQLLEAAEALAQRLEAQATQVAQDATQGMLEIERKYLLRGMPDIERLAREEALEVIALEIDQGWLPGERLRERLRRTRRAEGVTYERCMKLGSGVERIEVEEAIHESLFEALWPLTEGRRIHKRRYCVRDAGRLWEIDQFLDLPLVLAEVELEDKAVQPELPMWLGRLVAREVTDDSRYTNWRLAQKKAPPDEAGETETPDPVEVAVAREPAEVDGADGTTA